MWHVTATKWDSREPEDKNEPEFNHTVSGSVIQPKNKPRPSQSTSSAVDHA